MRGIVIVMRKLLILLSAILTLLAIIGCAQQSPPVSYESSVFNEFEDVSPPTPSPTFAELEEISTPAPTPPPQTEPPEISRSVVDVTDFSIVGSWKQTFGISGWESSNGRIVRFTEDYLSNIFSPHDTYGISGRGNGGMWLHVTGLLGGNLDYWVQVIDAGNIEVYHADKTTLAFEFLRLE